MVSKKNELIIKTYELLKELPPEEVKIRTIAAACGCTTPVIYKHFADLGELMSYASVRFLEPYIITVQKLMNEASDPLEMLMVMWREFSCCAFQNVDVFLEMFWGKYKNQLGDRIFEYYQLFPDEWRNLGGLMTTTFFNSDLYERNYTIVRRAASVGYFSTEEARLISDMQCCLMHGVLMDYRACYREKGKAEEGHEYFMHMLESMVSRYRIK